MYYETKCERQNFRNTKYNMENVFLILEYEKMS
jgi:hypothetical protein